MSYPILLVVGAVEALNLALFWVALRTRVSRLARPLIACCGVSGAWGAWILVLALHGPLWMLVLTGSGLAVSSVATGIAIHLSMLDEDNRGDGGAGRAPAVEPGPPDGGRSDEPSWWPEFQRQMVEYAAQQDREPEPIDC